jgi:uncharacterized integral membrane protein
LEYGLGKSSKARSEVPVRELSWEERNQLCGIVAVSILATFFVFLAYFTYLMENKLLPTIWDALLKLGLPFMLCSVCAAMISFEVGYHRKAKGPWKFHLKRLGGQLVLLLPSTLTFVGLVGLMDEVLSSATGGRGFMVGSMVWAVVFMVVILKFRRQVAKLVNGSW